MTSSTQDSQSNQDKNSEKQNLNNAGCGLSYDTKKSCADQNSVTSAMTTQTDKATVLYS